MQAAQADQAVVALVAAIPFDESPDQLAPLDVDARLRNLTEAARSLAFSRLSLIVDPDLRAQAEDAIKRFEYLRNARNRVIHDAVGVGLDFDGSVHPLAVEYRKGQGIMLHKVTADQVAALACEVYELNQDLQAIVSNPGRWWRSLRSPRPIIAPCLDNANRSTKYLRSTFQGGVRCELRQSKKLAPAVHFE